MDAIDRAALDAQTGGEPDLAREVLGLFAGQCRALLPGIADAGLPRAHRADLAHTLKGSAAGVGARRVQDLCDAVEARLRAGQGARQSAGQSAGTEADAALSALEAAVAAALRAIEAIEAGRV
jgi:HPt (histidine-containing phosphotransfer) domain-containing protein